MPLRDGFFSTATQTSCCNRIQRSNRVRLLLVSTHDFPDKRSYPSVQAEPAKKFKVHETSHVCMVTIVYSKSMDQPGKVASNPAGGQLNNTSYKT